MGYAIPIRCPECSRIHDVEIKDALVDEINGTVTYTFSCACGFLKHFENTSLDEIAALVSDLPESQHIADHLGISRESYESYVWPPDVRKAIDEQRRALPSSSTKKALRAGVVEVPKKHHDQWWLVYAILPPVLYDPKMKEYAILLDGGNVKVVGSIEAIVDALQT